MPNIPHRKGETWVRWAITSTCCWMPRTVPVPSTRYVGAGVAESSVMVA